MFNKLAGALLLFVLLFSLLIIGSYFYTLGVFNDGNTSLILSPDQFSDGSGNLSYRMIERDEVGMHRFEVAFAQSDLHLSDSDYSLLINRLAAQSYRIYLNGTYLGGAGSYEAMNSSVWNSMYRFEFDGSLLSPVNTLTLEIQALYDMGLADFPLIITDNRTASRIDTVYEIGQIWLRAINMGILICCALTMGIFLKFFKDSKRRKVFIYMAWAAVFGIIYFLDHFAIEWLPLSFLLYKKITIVSLYLMVSAVTLCFAEYFGFRRVKLIAYGTSLIAVAGALVADHNITYKLFYDKTSALLLINGLAWIYCAYGHDRNRNLKRMMMISAWVGVIFMVPVVMNMVLGRDSGIFFSIIQLMMMVIAVPILSLIVNEVTLLQNAVTHEKERWRELYEHSIRDGLTGLYTYSYMFEKITETGTPFVMGLLDMDNLKHINDAFGHLAGNSAIRLVADILTSGKTEGMVIGRFGGDEFIILSTDPLKDVAAYAEAVRQKVAERSEQEFGVRVTASIGIYESLRDEPTQFVFDYADKSLYRAKELGKNRVVIYGEND